MWTLRETSLVGAAIILIVGAIVIGWICFHFVGESKNYFESKSRRNVEYVRKLRNLAIAATVCFSLMCLSQAARDIYLFDYSLRNGDNNDKDYEEYDDVHSFQFLLDCITIILRSFAILFFLFFEVWRLQETFKNSNYPIRRRTAFILQIIIVFASVLAFVAVLLGQYIYHEYIQIVYYACGGFAYFLMLIVPIIVSNLFSQRLYQQALSMRESQLRYIACNLVKDKNEQEEEDENENDNNNKNSRAAKSSRASTMSGSVVVLSEKQEVLLKVMAKQTLLASFESFVMCIGVLILGAAYVIWYRINETDAYYVLYPFGILLFCLDGIIVAVCVWFSFIFTEKEYYQLCHKCHFKLLDLCRDRAVDKIEYLSMKHAPPNDDKAYIEFEQNNDSYKRMDN